MSIIQSNNNNINLQNIQKYVTHDYISNLNITSLNSNKIKITDISKIDKKNTYCIPIINSNTDGYSNIVIEKSLLYNSVDNKLISNNIEINNNGKFNNNIEVNNIGKFNNKIISEYIEINNELIVKNKIISKISLNDEIKCKNIEAINSNISNINSNEIKTNILNINKFNINNISCNNIITLKSIESSNIIASDLIKSNNINCNNLLTNELSTNLIKSDKVLFTNDVNIENNLKISNKIIANDLQLNNNLYCNTNIGNKLIIKNKEKDIKCCIEFEKNNLNLSLNNKNAFIISENGNIGIGNDFPKFKLDIGEDTHTHFNNYNSGTNYLMADKRNILNSQIIPLYDITHKNRIYNLIKKMNITCFKYNDDILHPNSIINNYSVLFNDFDKIIPGIIKQKEGILANRMDQFINEKDDNKSGSIGLFKQTNFDNFTEITFNFKKEKNFNINYIYSFYLNINNNFKKIFSKPFNSNTIRINNNNEYYNKITIIGHITDLKYIDFFKINGIYNSGLNFLINDLDDINIKIKNIENNINIYKSENIENSSYDKLNISNREFITSSEQKKIILENAKSDINIGEYILSSKKFISTTINEAPFQINSKIKVNNLNADLLDGVDSSRYVILDKNQLISNKFFENCQTTTSNIYDISKNIATNEYVHMVVNKKLDKKQDAFNKNINLDSKYIGYGTVSNEAFSYLENTKSPIQNQIDNLIDNNNKLNEEVLFLKSEIIELKKLISGS